MSPFKALYGQDCLTPLTWSNPMMRVDVSKQMLDEILRLKLPLLVLANRGSNPGLPEQLPYTLVTKPVKQSDLYKAIAGVFEKNLVQTTDVPLSNTKTNPLKIKAGTRILVVEDNLVNQKVLIKMLKTLGQTATVANNGREALTVLEREQFSLILMDCQMPEMDGYEAAGEIRKREKGTRRIPIIALTAAAMQGDRERCIAAGMDDYLSKPIDAARLDAAIRRWTAAPRETPPVADRPVSV